MARKVPRKPERKLSTAAWFGIGCGGALLIGLIVLVILYALAMSGPALPPEATASRATPEETAIPDAPSPPAAPDEERPRERAPASPPPLRQQIDWVEQTARQSDRPVPTTVTVRQEELNSLIQQEGSGDIRNMRVYFGEGTMAATGDVQYRGRNVSLTVRARPFVSGGELDVDVLEVRVGRLAAPSPVKEEVRGQLQRGVRDLASRDNVRIQSVTVNPGVMILSGQVGGR